MRRTLIVLSVACLLALLFFYALAGAEPQTRYFAETSLGLFIIIVAVVAVSSILTMLLVWLFSNRLQLGDRIARRSIPSFVGWKLLRSHRLVPTRRSRVKRALYELRARTPKGKLLLLTGGLALLACAGLLWGPAAWNGLADAVSPEFARILQLALALLGGALALVGLFGLVLGKRPDAAPRPDLRPRSGVSLPTFISIVGVAIGIWALIVVLGVMHGLQSDLRKKILRTGAHLVMEPVEAHGALGDALALEQQLRDVPGIKEAHAYVHGEVMVSSPANVAVNVVVKGMSAAAMASSEQLAGRLESGSVRWIQEPERLLPDRFRFPFSLESEQRLPPAELYPGVLIGAELARNLSVDVGSEIQLISPDGDVGPTGLRPKLSPFRVAGIFKTGMYQFDQKLAYIAIDDAQRFFNYGSDLNRLEARFDDAEAVDARRIAVEAAVNTTAAGLVMSDWRERNKNLFSALQLERIVMFIILGFIIFVASLLIVSSLVMLIVEKTKEIAVLKALGASDRSIVRAFLVIGSFIGIFGVLAGVPLGVVTCVVIITQGFTLPREFYIDTLPVSLDAVDITFVGLAALGMCLLATLYPSLQASRLRPADGLRHG